MSAQLRVCVACTSMKRTELRLSYLVVTLVVTGQTGETSVVGWTEVGLVKSVLVLPHCLSMLTLLQSIMQACRHNARICSQGPEVVTGHVGTC